MKKSNTMILTLLMVSFSLLIGCGDSSKKTETKKHNNPVACQNQTLNTGIPGNTACPYKGGFDPQLGYEGYAIVQASARLDVNVGIGFKIDFGYEYNDLCPVEGQIPVVNNGALVECRQVNPVFAETDYENATLPNTGECAGTQYNSNITGCGPNLRPSN